MVNFIVLCIGCILSCSVIKIKSSWVKRKKKSRTISFPYSPPLKKESEEKNRKEIYEFYSSWKWMYVFSFALFQVLFFSLRMCYIDVKYIHIDHLSVNVLNTKQCNLDYCKEFKSAFTIFDAILFICLFFSCMQMLYGSLLFKYTFLFIYHAT